jgi:hypothetical protein
MKKENCVSFAVALQTAKVVAKCLVKMEKKKALNCRVRAGCWFQARNGGLGAYSLWVTGLLYVVYGDSWQEAAHQR